jgi:hypothetical protein
LNYWSQEIVHGKPNSEVYLKAVNRLRRLFGQTATKRNIFRTHCGLFINLMPQRFLSILMNEFPFAIF